VYDGTNFTNEGVDTQQLPTSMLVIIALVVGVLDDEVVVGIIDDEDVKTDRAILMINR
jgi:hypothetical protein